MSSDLEGKGEFREASNHWECSDYAKAIPALMKLARSGHDKSQQLIAVSFQCGWGLEHDIQSAVDWFKLSAENGNPLAALQLAFIYDPSNEVKYSDLAQNQAAADSYYRSAFVNAIKRSNQSDIEAMDCLAMCYSNGWGCEIDLVEARRWKKFSEKNALVQDNSDKT